MMRLLSIIFLIAFFIYEIIDCILTNSKIIRNISKLSWIFIMFFIPIIGGILWIFLGRPNQKTKNSFISFSKNNEKLKAPDDDSDFLQSFKKY